MDAMAAIGSMVVTEGSSAAAIVAAHTQDSPSPAPTWSTRDHEQADRAFAHYQADAGAPSTSLGATLLVVTACMSTLKGIALDESEKKEDDEDELRETRRQEK